MAELMNEDFLEEQDQIFQKDQFYDDVKQVYVTFVNMEANDKIFELYNNHQASTHYESLTNTIKSIFVSKKVKKSYYEAKYKQWLQ